MNEEENIYQSLLTEVEKKRKSLEADWKKTGEMYNIFKIVRIDDKEVKMCRVLADLLNPKGLHYQESAYLELFMDEVVIPLIVKTGRLDLLKAKITPERKIDNDRLIDIVIDDGVIYIPIEVKFGAREQPNQIADYAAFSRKMNISAGFIPVLFITPCWYKSVEAEKDDYVQITFEKHIIPWLKKCLSLEETEKVSPVKEVLKQFIKAIESFCGNSEDAEMDDEIFKLVTKNDDSVRAALAICRVTNFYKKILETFKGSVLKLVKEKIPDKNFKEEGEYHLFPIKDGKYYFAINYLWSKAFVQASSPDYSKDDTSADGKAFYEKMSENTMLNNIPPSPQNGYAWYTEGIVWPDFDRNDTLHLYKLWKLYTENPEKVADKIVNIVRALESV